MRKAGLMLIGVVLLAMMGCATTKFTDNYRGTYNLATITTKDYEVVGSVSLTADDIFEVGPFGWTQTHSGSTVTAQLLAEEAWKLGADDVINIRMDRYEDYTTNSILDPIVGYTKTYRWVGNALAIKYTNSVPGERAPQAPSVTLPRSDNTNNPQGSDAPSGILGLIGKYLGHF
jgi:hypothetical protein